MPIVSVIMAVLNQREHVARSIESVLNQTFSDFEYIIVDDFSSDGTIVVLEKYSRHDPRITVIKNDSHAGIAKSVNRAFVKSYGNYIARIDSDDAWIDKDKLKLQVEFLQIHPDYAAVGGGMVVVDTEGKELFRYLKPENDEHIRKTALLTNPIANSTSLCRRSAIESDLLCDETLAANEDWDFWLRVGLKGKLYNFPLFFSYYTIGVDNHSFKNIRTYAATGILILNRYKRYYPRYLRGIVMNAVKYIYGCIPRVQRSLLNPFFSRYKKIITGSTVTYKGRFH